MRKIIWLLTVFALLVSCSFAVAAENTKTDENGKILVAYFSRTGENYNVGTISEGNTAKLAKEIAA